MNIPDASFSVNYLENLPLNRIAKFSGGPPKNTFPFTGYPQQHPAEKNKLILVYDPLGSSPMVLEFKLDDILYAEEVSRAVTEKGEGIPLVKLWIRRGARGMLLEPFEVDETVNFMELRREQKEKFTKKQASDQKARDKKPYDHKPAGSRTQRT
jgi:hypothetical protein